MEEEEKKGEKQEDEEDEKETGKRESYHMARKKTMSCFSGDSRIP